MTQNKSFRNGVDCAFHRVSQVVGNLNHQLQDAHDLLLDVPERVYPPSTRSRINALPSAGHWIFKEVLDAMQDAEEIGGPEGDEYIDLMNAIIQEATERAHNAATLIQESAHE